MRSGRGARVLIGTVEGATMKAAVAVAAATAIVMWVAGGALAQGPSSSPGHVQAQMGVMGGGMMCPMMGVMGGMPMMGGAQDPKTLGRMLQLRGEMMRAVGDVLLKHGKALEGSGG